MLYYHVSTSFLGSEFHDVLTLRTCLGNPKALRMVRPTV